AYDRYVRRRRTHEPIEVWKFNRQITTIHVGTQLRIQADLPFLLHWTADEWRHFTDTQSTATALGIDFVDVSLPETETTIRFTFLWVDESRWEGKDYAVEIRGRAGSGNELQALEKNAQSNPVVGAGVPRTAPTAMGESL